MKTASPVRSWPIGIVAILVATLMVACGATPTSPSDYAPFSTQDLVVGTGLQAVSGSVVSVTYTLWLYDSDQPDNKGPQVETNVDREPFSFTIGGGQTIDGWERGIPGMMEGGVRRLVVPPSLAYGQGRNGLIPPNATLLFEVSLITVS
jgi:FKBP-type peptidyl-prolyl cis-trans isomerase